MSGASVGPTTVTDADIALPMRRWLPTLSAQIGPLIGLLFIVALFSILRPHTFLSTANWQVMLMQTAVVGTAALGATMVIISGGIDLSVGSNIALTTVIVATLLADGWPPLWAALGGVAAGSLLGLLIGVLVAYGGLQSFIVTLGMWGAVRGLAKGLAHEMTVDPGRETWLNQLLRMLAPGEQRMIFPIGVWMTLVLAVFVAAMLRYTRFGRHIFAIGSNELTARLCGVPVNRTKVLIYVLAGLFGAIAGVLQFSSLTIGDPTTAMGKELDVIAAVVIGGASLLGGEGTISGTLIGALIMTVIANGCTKLGLSNWVQEIVTGAIIILAVGADRLRHKYPQAMGKLVEIGRLWKTR
jgi:ribose/xylose/arabinose/galactoside ABC-type transport system permease subunit